MRVWRGVLAALLLSCSGAAIAQPVAGQLVYEYNRSANITTLTTTNVKPGPGLLAIFCVNTAGATANNAVIWDSLTASGTKLATIDTTTVGCKTYNLQFLVGLTIVTATGTPADITVSFR